MRTPLPQPTQAMMGYYFGSFFSYWCRMESMRQESSPGGYTQSKSPFKTTWAYSSRGKSRALLYFAFYMLCMKNIIQGLQVYKKPLIWLSLYLCTQLNSELDCIHQMYKSPYNDSTLLTRKGEISPWSFYHQHPQPYLSAQVEYPRVDNTLPKDSTRSKELKSSPSKKPKQVRSQLINFKPQIQVPDYHDKLELLQTQINQLFAERMVLRSLQKYLSTIDKRHSHLIRANSKSPFKEDPVSKNKNHSESTNSSVCFVRVENPSQDLLLPNISGSRKKQKPNYSIQLPKLKESSSMRRAIPITSFRAMDTELPIHVQCQGVTQEAQIKPNKVTIKGVQASRHKKLGNIRLVHLKITGKSELEKDKDGVKYMKLKTIQNESG